MSAPRGTAEREAERRGFLLRAATWLGDQSVRWARSLVELKPQSVWGVRGVDTYRHVILVNNVGMPVPVLVGNKVPTFAPQGWVARFPLERQFLPEDEYGLQLRQIMLEIKDAKKPVAIIVHGGLNFPAGSLKIAARLVKSIGDDYYPIFIVWDSSPLAYLEQLLLVRSGRYSRWGPITSPFLLFGDLLSCIGLAFTLIPSQVRSLWVGTRYHSDPATRIAGEVCEHKPGIDLAPPQYTARRLRPIDGLLRASLWLALSLIRVPLALLITAGAPRYWQNLQRRARAMFRAPQEFDPMVAGPQAVSNGADFQQATGAVAVLVRRLVETIGVKSATPMKVTLIAHSMGATVTNEFIQYAGDGLSYEDIVYMAPACSVRAFADAVVPVLERNIEATRDKKVDAYVLTLSPKVEMNQSTSYRVLPRGSVLEWLEGFVDPPKAPLDRFLGKFDNIVRALHIFPKEVRELIHIKVFPFDENNPEKPYTHSHFFRNPDVQFWKRTFWEP